MKAASAVSYSLLRSGHPRAQAPQAHRFLSISTRPPVPSHSTPGSDVSAPNHNTTQYEPTRPVHTHTRDDIQTRARQPKDRWGVSSGHSTLPVAHAAQQKGNINQCPLLPRSSPRSRRPRCGKGPSLLRACVYTPPLSFERASAAAAAPAAQPNSSCKSHSKHPPTAVLIAAYRTAKRR